MRPDLHALSDDSLAAVSNRGIVKRALKEVAEGKGPALVEDNGTVTATFDDGTTVVLAPGDTIEQSRCTCPASGVCRHRVMLVIASRSTAAGAEETATAEAGTYEAWTPGAFTDEALEAYIGSRTFAAARKTLRAGYRARVRRPTPTDPVPTVELAACTVRFLVPHELGYARVDAARGAREDAIALAVWACRTADELDQGAPALDVQAGGATEPSSATSSGIEPAVELLEGLLADGITGTGPEIATSFAQARRVLDARNLRWPVDVLDDLHDQLDAYRTRSSRYAAADAAAHAAEAIARHRCVTGRGASLRVQVLGTEETAETPLRLLRLTGLGARVRGDDTSRTVEIYLAHPEAGVVLALRRRIDAADDTDVPSAAELGRRKAGGARLSALAAANVVTESAVRSATRIVRIAESRLAKTTVAPSAGRWDTLPDGILVTDLDHEAIRLAGRPPSVVRPRVVAETVRAVAIEAVEDIHYLPGAQQLRATVQASTGRAQLVLTHSAATPGALDSLARALGDQDHPVRYVAGHLRRHGGGIEIEPTAVVHGDNVTVPAFAEATGGTLASAPPEHADRLAAAVADAIELSAEVLHRGHRHLPPGWGQRAQRTAEHLRQAGLASASQSVASLADIVRYGGSDLLDRWADTHIRLLVTAEQL